jgi:hypothetical protein
MEEVGRKLYLSQTPSIVWEAKTLGAKRRVSSSEIATVPGTLLVEFQIARSQASPGQIIDHF